MSFKKKKRSEDGIFNTFSTGGESGTIPVRRGKEKKITVKVSRVRLYDALALLTAVIGVVLDQWTKAWVVANLVENSRPVPLVGNSPALYYNQNNGAPFSRSATA